VARGAHKGINGIGFAHGMVFSKKMEKRLGLEFMPGQYDQFILAVAAIIQGFAAGIIVFMLCKMVYFWWIR
jgi:hypothetical protein